ncbi:MAG: Unknown protein [uncultured Sulfurovum sp.]|uniref:Uncharacterized protein n=1 Tax=uncultured Sulfurovum sp. TaxID=269237 RepID=A0A6S6UKZ6_9BACT|nr:MAG: Unknown protein [uncultured Sulfurovum sp.]
MPYYHVLVTFTDSPKDPQCVLDDLSEQELKTKFVGLYKKGKDILCDKDVVRIGNIKSVQIIRTNKKSEDERSIIQEKSFKRIEELNRQSDSITIISPGYGYSPGDIAVAGEDVTSQYITRAPGHEASNFIFSLLNNPWVMTIGTGLILAALVAWLGLG